MHIKGVELALLSSDTSEHKCVTEENLRMSHGFRIFWGSYQMFADGNTVIRFFVPTDPYWRKRYSIKHPVTQGFSM